MCLLRLTCLSVLASVCQGWGAKLGCDMAQPLLVGKDDTRRSKAQTAIGGPNKDNQKVRGQTSR